MALDMAEKSHHENESNHGKLCGRATCAVRMEPTSLARSRKRGSFTTSGAKRLRNVIHEESSRNNNCCWPQPSGRAVPITAAPNGVESFQQLRPGT
jgi:hypothetical protein